MSSRVTTQLLGYSGLLPFFGFCIGFSVMEDWPRSLSIQGFVIYSLAIFAFLAGALWGQEQRVESASSVSTLVVSNGLVLFGVASILTAQAMMASVFLIRRRMPAMVPAPGCFEGSSVMDARANRPYRCSAY